MTVLARVLQASMAARLRKEQRRSREAESRRQELEALLTKYGSRGSQLQEQLQALGGAVEGEIKGMTKTLKRQADRIKVRLSVLGH